MKIQAKIPFTYLYPEQNEPKRYFINETITAEEDGGEYFAETTSVGYYVMMTAAPETITVVFDGVTYADIPKIGDEGTPAYGQEWAEPMVWNDYPFVIETNDIACQTEGDHTIAIYYNLPMVKLTIGNSSASDIPAIYLVAGFDENGIYTSQFFGVDVKPSPEYQEVAIGESVTLDVPVNVMGTAVGYFPGIQSVDATNAAVESDVGFITDVTTPECSISGEWHSIS